MMVTQKDIDDLTGKLLEARDDETQAFNRLFDGEPRLSQAQRKAILGDLTVAVTTDAKTLVECSARVVELSNELAALYSQRFKEARDE